MCESNRNGAQSSDTHIQPFFCIHPLCCIYDIHPPDPVNPAFPSFHILLLRPTFTPLHDTPLRVSSKMSSTPFKGSLKAKRKGELTEIAQALGIGLDQSEKKEELEDLIREHLMSNKNQYSSNENFKGLIESLDSRKRSARSSSVNGNA